MQNNTTDYDCGCVHQSFSSFDDSIITLYIILYLYTRVLYYNNVMATLKISAPQKRYFLSSLQISQLLEVNSLSYSTGCHPFSLTVRLIAVHLGVFIVYHTSIHHRIYEKQDYYKIYTVQQQQSRADQLYISSNTRELLVRTRQNIQSIYLVGLAALSLDSLDIDEKCYLSYPCPCILHIICNVQIKQSRSNSLIYYQ